MLLQKINPLEIPIEKIKGHSMIAQVEKPLIITPGIEKHNRKVYFSSMKLGDKLSLLSAPTMIHEISHLAQEKNIGYTEDVYNKEIISIFLEKVSALELDPTGNLLKLSERKRFNHILGCYMSIRNKNIKDFDDQDINNFTYVKSTLYAEKLFDMYLQEKKQKKKDKYFYQIQDVFDGKKQVEDIINEREITPGRAADFSTIKKHI